MHRLIRSLRRNRSLLALLADGNQSTVEVWQELRDCLTSDNSTLCHLDLPTIDIAALSTRSRGSDESQERVKSIWEAISLKLNSNREACENTAAYRQLCRFQFCVSDADEELTPADHEAETTVSFEVDTPSATASLVSEPGGTTPMLMVTPDHTAPNPDQGSSDDAVAERKLSLRSSRRNMASMYLRSGRITFNPAHSSVAVGQLNTFHAMIAGNASNQEACDNADDQNDEEFVESDDVLDQAIDDDEEPPSHTPPSPYE
jgi:hypothetical protein